MRLWAIVTFAILLLAPHARAQEALLGNWKLVSFYTEDTQTKQRTNTYGENPAGAIGFTPAGRFFAFAAAEGRKTPQGIEDQAAAFRTIIAYTGKWRAEGDKFITKVDVAANPALVGTEQIRFWRVENGKLFVTTAPLPDPNTAGRTLVGTLVWERE